METALTDPADGYLPADGQMSVASWFSRESGAEPIEPICVQCYSPRPLLQHLLVTTSDPGSDCRLPVRVTAAAAAGVAGLETGRWRAALRPRGGELSFRDTAIIMPHLITYNSGN